jgi:hypothetical protein
MLSCRGLRDGHEQNFPAGSIEAKYSLVVARTHFSLPSRKPGVALVVGRIDKN